MVSLFQGFINFILSPDSQSIVTIAVGSFVFILYKLEKNDREKSSASIILEELRAIEANISRLKEFGDLSKVMPSGLSTTGWVQHKSVVMKNLDYDQRNEVSTFYEKVDSLRETILQWRYSYFKSMEAKSQGMQHKLIEIAGTVKSGEDYLAEKKKIEDLIHTDSYWFEPSIIRVQMNSILPQVNPISTGIIGEKIKEITKRNIKNIFT